MDQPCLAPSAPKNSHPLARLLLAAVAAQSLSLAACGRRDDAVVRPKPRPLTFQTGGVAPAPLQIEAESLEQNADVQIFPAPPAAPVGISFLDDGDEIVYRGVNFGALGTFRSFTVRLATPHSANRIELWADARGAGGKKLGELVTAATGPDFGTMASQTAALAPIAGVHDLVVHINGEENAAAEVNGWGHGVGNLDWFAFSSVPAPDGRGLRWVRSWQGDIPHGAVAEGAGGGRVCRVTVEEGVFAGRLVGTGCRYVRQGSTEEASEYEALVARGELGVVWADAAATTIPAIAIRAATPAAGAPLVICRLQSEGQWVAGGVSGAEGCRAAKDGVVLASTTFQILKKAVAPVSPPTQPAAGSPFGRPTVLPADLADPTAPPQWTTPLVSRSAPVAPNPWVAPPLAVDPNVGRP